MPCADSYAIYIWFRCKKSARNDSANVIKHSLSVIERFGEFLKLKNIEAPLNYIPQDFVQFSEIDEDFYIVLVNIDNDETITFHNGLKHKFDNEKIAKDTHIDKSYKLTVCQF